MKYNSLKQGHIALHMYLHWSWLLKRARIRSALACWVSGWRSLLIGLFVLFLFYWFVAGEGWDMKFDYISYWPQLLTVALLYFHVLKISDCSGLSPEHDFLPNTSSFRSNYFLSSFHLFQIQEHIRMLQGFEIFWKGICSGKCLVNFISI